MRKRHHRRQKVAASCPACGHIRDDREPVDRCRACGLTAVPWMTAPILDEPADVLAPAVGEAVSPLDDMAAPWTPDPQSLFAVAPPGVAAGDVNPELRVRY